MVSAARCFAANSGRYGFEQRGPEAAAQISDFGQRGGLLHRDEHMNQAEHSSKQSQQGKNLREGDQQVHVAFEPRDCLNARLLNSLG